MKFHQEYSTRTFSRVVLCSCNLVTYLMGHDEVTLFLLQYVVKLQMDKDDVTLSHPITTIYNKNTSVLQPHVGCLKRAKKEENVLQNILHLLKFTFWASLLSKPQRTALVASKKCHTTVLQVASKLLQLAFTCEHFFAS